MIILLNLVYDLSEIILYHNFTLFAKNDDSGLKKNILNT